MTEILEEKDYNKFELLEFNRDEKSTKTLEESMRKYGWWDDSPMSVIKTRNGKLKIKKGHHRFIAAKKLGIPVKYVFGNQDVTIFEAELTTRPWKLNDFFVAMTREGKDPNCTVIKNYCDKTGIPLRAAISLLGGESAGSGNLQIVFKQGNYKVKGQNGHAEIVGDIIIHTKAVGLPFATHDLYVRAISKVARVQCFSPSRMKQKISTFARYMDKRAHLQQYLDMIEDVYNKSSQKKIPLRFLADQEACARGRHKNLKS